MASSKSSTRFGSFLSLGGLLSKALGSESGRRKSARPRGRTRLTFETLDRRELFSASPVTSPVGHSPTPVKVNLPAVVQSITSPDGKDQAANYRERERNIFGRGERQGDCHGE